MLASTTTGLLMYFEVAIMSIRRKARQKNVQLTILVRSKDTRGMAG
jgi:hypothetical protein